MEGQPHIHCLQPGLLCHCALASTSHPAGTEWLFDGVAVDAGQWSALGC